MNPLMRTEKSSRWAAILLATIVAIITSAVVANATQTITTPNAVKITYNLAAGADSAAITPATNTSVLVMGCSTSGGTQAVGQVSLVRTSVGTIVWVGLESYPSATITQGASIGHMVYIDFFHKVDIQTISGESIRVHNASNGVQAGNVTLIW
jgi:hypothetical protein